MSMTIGYARVSTDEQSLALQIDALTAAGCGRVFSDTASGRAATRAGLADALSHLRAGDTLAVWKLDRLGRSVAGLIALVGDLEKRGVAFRSLTDGIDTSTPAGRFFFHVMASLAQMERELIVERTQAGLTAARQRGRVGGRKRKMTAARMEAGAQLLAAGQPAGDVAAALGVSRATLYRWLPAAAAVDADE